MNTDRELSYREFIMRENNAFHAPYYPEFAFYIAVKSGEVNQVSQLHTAMAMDYAQRMKHIRKKQIFSRQIEKCIDYIYNNLHKRILMTELARYTDLNPSYLSRLFKKETGVTVTEYIQGKKIDTARNMLQFSSYLPSQIASILAFPSQSYFIEVFRKKTGMTPKKYQDTCFRETGLINTKKTGE